LPKHEHPSECSECNTITLHFISGGNSHKSVTTQRNTFAVSASRYDAVGFTEKSCVHLWGMVANDCRERKGISVANQSFHPHLSLRFLLDCLPHPSSHCIKLKKKISLTVASKNPLTVHLLPNIYLPPTIKYFLSTANTRSSRGT
jgi:hypothetical protein